MKTERPLVDAFFALAARESWTVTGPITPGGDGFALRTQGDSFHVVLNLTSAARGPELEQALADAALRARNAAGKKTPPMRPLAVVAAPKLSTRMLARLDEYADRYLARFAWAAFDLTGLWHAKGMGKTIRPSRSARLSIRPTSPLVSFNRAKRTDPFSDLGQWLAKVVLAQDIPTSLLEAPRVLLRNRSVLAQAAKVSLPTVSRWASALEEDGFLADSGSELRIVRRLEFLKRWAGAVHSRTYFDHWVRPVIGSSQPTKLMHRVFEVHPQAVLLGASACDHLGVGVVHGAPLQMAVPAVDARGMEAMGLAAAKEGESGALMLRVPRFPQSLARGAVQLGESRVADAIQCAVDSLLDPVRGSEQFAAILRVLEIES